MFWFPLKIAIVCESREIRCFPVAIGCKVGWTWLADLWEFCSGILCDVASPQLQRARKPTEKIAIQGLFIPSHLDEVHQQITRGLCNLNHTPCFGVVPGKRGNRPCGFQVSDYPTTQSGECYFQHRNRRPLAWLPSCRPSVSHESKSGGTGPGSKIQQRPAMRSNSAQP